MKVSVIIPVYNSASYIEECIQSCIIQEEVGEIIVIDDGSTDGSRPILEKLKARHSKIIILEHQNRCNLGAGPSRNLGIEHASCEYISFLDADDYFFEDRFITAISILDQNTSIDGIYESVVSIVEKSHPYQDSSIIYGFSKESTGMEALEDILICNTGVSTITGFTYRTEFIKDNDIKCLNIKRAQELNIKFGGAVYGNINILPSMPKLTRRLHGTNSILNVGQGLQDYKTLFTYWFFKTKNLELSPICHRYFLKQYIHYGFGIQAFKSRALRLLLKPFAIIFTLVTRPWIISKIL